MVVLSGVETLYRVLGTGVKRSQPVPPVVPPPRRTGILIRMSTEPSPFELTIPVKPEDIDELGHASNIVYLRWVQDVAVAHWRSLAPPEELARLWWVVLRHEIDYKHPARLGDQIMARTWVGAASRLRFERHTELLRAADRCLLARAHTLWCPIDATTRKPVSVGPEVRARFSVAEGGAL